MGEIDRTRAAANSIARGIPWKRAQIPMVDDRSRSVGANESSAANARPQITQRLSSPGRATRPHEHAHPALPRVPDADSSTQHVTVGHADTIVAITSTTGANTCSQLSKINKARRSRSHDMIDPSTEAPGCVSIDNTAASDTATASGSAIGASSANHTAPLNSSANNQPISVASLVFPAPGGG